MARTHTEIQAAKTKGAKDIEQSDESLDGLRAILFPDREGLYTGPGSYTAREIQIALKLSNHENARARARKAVMAGEMVEVKVLRVRSNGGEHVATGWVVKAEYDKWMDKQEK